MKTTITRDGEHMVTAYKREPGITPDKARTKLVPVKELGRLEPGWVVCRCSLCWA